MSDSRANQKTQTDKTVICREAARLLHDLSTPLLTVRALATLIPADGDGADLAMRMETQLDRINARLEGFWQTINTAECSPRETVPAHKETPDAAEASPSDARLHVLLVDDDDIHRDIGGRLLTRLGHQVTLCNDLAEAGRLCAINRYDVIFLDQHGPGMLGSDLARHYSVSMSNPAPWIIGMSSDPRLDEMRGLCLDAGMQDYMAKPITPEKLSAVLKRRPSR